MVCTIQEEGNAFYIDILSFIISVQVFTHTYNSTCMLLWLGIKFTFTYNWLNSFSNEKYLIIFNRICIQLCITFLYLQNIVAVGTSFFYCLVILGVLVYSKPFKASQVVYLFCTWTFIEDNKPKLFTVIL